MRDRSSMPPPPRYNVELAEFFSTFTWVGTAAVNIVLGGGGLGTRSIVYHVSIPIMFCLLAKFFLPPLGFIEIALVVVSCEPLPQDAPVTSSGLVWALG